MLRVEWSDNAGSFDWDGAPSSDTYYYRKHTTSLYELVGTVNSGKFEGDDLVLELRGDDLSYETNASGQMRLSGGTVNELRYVVNGLLMTDVTFDPAPDASTVFETLTEEYDRGSLYFGNRFSNFLEGAGGTDKIYGRDGNDEIFGRGGRDSLYGGDGDDTLDGGALGDRMSGGDGDDLFLVQNIRDRIVEAAGGGKDSVRA